VTKAGATFAPLANPMMKTKLVRTLMEVIIGIDRKTILSVFHFETFKKWMKKNV